MARPIRAIFVSTLIAGTLLLGAAFLLATASGRGLFPVLRELAAAIFGEEMRERAWGGVLTGLALHFAMIALVVRVYASAAQRFEFPRRHALWGGLALGALLAAIHALLAPRGLPTVFPQITAADLAAAPAAWLVCVGLPVGWLVARQPL